MKPESTRARIVPEPERIGFLLCERFPILSFASAVEPLRLANRQAGRELYCWKLLSEDGAPALSSSGVEVRADGALRDAGRLHTLFVVAGAGIEHYRSTALLSWLRALARAGCTMGALTLGTWLLARAGVQDGYRCTLHWEYIDAFREEFPRLDVSAEVFEVDRSRMSCAGGTASLDLVLSLIARSHGRDLAAEVADLSLHSHMRDSEDGQRAPLRTRLGISHRGLIKVVGLMEQHLEHTLTRDQLAECSGVSGRQIERLFRKHLGTTPGQYYLDLRLRLARRLLHQTSMPIADIAIASGFVTASHFTKCYRDHMHTTPSRDRAPMP